jgi:hypothetical protein
MPKKQKLPLPNYQMLIYDSITDRTVTLNIHHVTKDVEMVFFKGAAYSKKKSIRATDFIDLLLKGEFPKE